MTIRDVEERTGLTRANIRYYEQEGLLHPKREANGYRDYGEEDMNTLGRIRLLRQLGVSIEQLRALQSGEVELASVLTEAQNALEQQRTENDEAQALCQRLQRDAVSYHTLDAEKYTKEAETPPSSVWDSITTRDAERPITNIWRRYCARMLDYTLYQVLWRLAAGVGLRMWLTNKTSLAVTLGEALITLFLMAVLEPLWLQLWGTTPGKLIFGLHLEQEDGSRPSYAQGFERTCLVIWHGMGAGIPVLNLIRLVSCASRCSDGEEMRWEQDAELYYSIRDEKWLRFVAAAGVYALLLAVAAFAALYPMTPPNRGDLTPEELVENYNYYAAKLEINVSAMEYADGQLRVRKIPYVNEDAGKEQVVVTKRWALVEKDGVVTCVNVMFTPDGAGRYEGGHKEEQLLWALSLAGAQKSVGLFSGVRGELQEYIAANGLSDYVYALDGYELRNDVTYSGYEGVTEAFLLSEDDDYSFAQSFMVKRR